MPSSSVIRIRVSEPRNVRSSTIPCPGVALTISSASGRTSTSHRAAGRVTVGVGRGQARAEDLDPPAREDAPGTRFIVPTNSATNGVAGWS